MRRARVALLALGTVAAGWLDPHATAREAARLHAAGKYEEAVARYNEALTDQPDSPLLHFNLGAAAYRQGKYADALKAFQEVLASDADPARTARAAYNVGNVKYRLGETAEASDPQAALGLWAEALVAYRRAMGAAPDGADAKFNHELVERKIAELRKKLEEQQREQQQDEQPEQPGSDEQGAGEGQEKTEDERSDAPEQQAEQNAPEAAPREERQNGAMTPEEAMALLDSQRDQEVQPGEVAQRLQGAVIGEAAEDW